MNIKGFYFTIIKPDYGKVYVCFDDILMLTFEIKKTKDGRFFLTSPSIKRTYNGKEYYDRHIRILDNTSYNKLASKLITAFQSNVKSNIAPEANNFKQFIDKLTNPQNKPVKQESSLIVDEF